METYKAIALEGGSELEKLILAKAAKNFKLRNENERFDLFPFFCILVSTGTNKNTDHFDPVELWRAKNSPVDKPVNIGHNQTRIIGHIVDNICVGEDLQPIPDDTSEGDLPYKLHVVTAAVIYKVWEDPKVQAEVNELIDKISKGSTYVSMECLFRDFAFLLTNAATQEQKIIQRTPETAGLTKYLRQYKGSGKIYNYSLARVLKNITFSAVGIVDKPANPDSIISANLDLFNSTASEDVQNSVYINLDVNLMENHMAEKVIATEIESLKAEIETLKSENTHLHDCVAKSKEVTMADVKEKDESEETKAESMPNPPDTGKKKLKGKDKSSYAEDNTSTADDETDTEMASLKTSVAELEKKVKDLESEKASLATANDAMNATIDEFKKASRHSDRAEAMMNADALLTRDNAVRIVATYDEMGDKAFATMVEMMKGYASRSPKEVTAETIINNAKAETDIPMGNVAENNYSKVSADIKNFIKTEKKGS